MKIPSIRAEWFLTDILAHTIVQLDAPKLEVAFVTVLRKRP